MSESMLKMESQIASIDNRLANIETLLFSPFVTAWSTTDPVSAINVTFPGSLSTREHHQKRTVYLIGNEVFQRCLEGIENTYQLN